MVKDKNNLDLYVKHYKDLEIIKNNKKMKINLGAGFVSLKGFINTDMIKSSNLDVICRIEDLPFKSNIFDLIYSRHVLEHVDNFSRSLEEIYRILKHKGIAYIVVPYGKSFSAYYPDHKRFFNLYSFNIFDKSRHRTFKINDICFKILKIKYRYQIPSNMFKKLLTYMFGIIANNHKEEFEKNISHLFPPYEIEFILRKC